MTFKDLKKRVTLEAAQECKLFGRLLNKSFWIWNVEEHKQVDIRTNGDCCFNHIIDLPKKDGHSHKSMLNQKIFFGIMLAVLAFAVTAATAVNYNSAYAAKPCHSSQSNGGTCFPSNQQCIRNAPGKSGEAQC